MRRLFLFAIVLALCGGIGFMVRNAGRQDSVPIFQDTNPVQTRAAFRDGLYLGGLAAERGEEPHVSEGRWSNQADRTLFVRPAISKAMTGGWRFGQPWSTVYVSEIAEFNEPIDFSSAEVCRNCEYFNSLRPGRYGSRERLLFWQCSWFAAGSV